MKKAHQHLIKWGLNQGYTIQVECEGYTDYEGTSFDDAVEAVESCDIGVIYFVEGTHTEGEPVYLAGFSYILEYDRSPDEIISDWGINEVSIAWDQDYTAHCKKYPINKHFSRSNN
jgi:hypothetical protein